MKKLIGTKQFYKMVLLIAVPIMIQNGITNFVSLLDNIMVGRIGTEQMSGVAIVNQIIFIFNLCVFGGVSGAGVFTAQFHGQGNEKGVRDTFRFKLIVCVLICVAFLLIIAFGGDTFIQRYLHEGSNTGDLLLTAQYAQEYLKICILELLPFAIIQVYVSTLRETGETVVPMIAGMIAVLVNLVFNYILIFGKFGAPVLGVSGAAIATVISRFVELIIVVTWTHMHSTRNHFIVGAYKTMKIPSALAWKMFVKGTPLFINEGMWAAGQTVIMQCYSMRGISVVAALNITSTITNLFNIVFLALGSAIAIVVGQKLGAGDMEEAKTSAYQMITFSVMCCIVVAAIMLCIGHLFPEIYNVSDEVKMISSKAIQVSALLMPMQAYLHASYFTIRSGGKTLITFLFDSCFVWVITIPLAYVLTKFTGLDIIPLYAFVQLGDIIKCIIGFCLVKSGMWMHNIVQNETA